MCVLNNIWQHKNTDQQNKQTNNMHQTYNAFGMKEKLYEIMQNKMRAVAVVTYSRLMKIMKKKKQSIL